MTAPFAERLLAWFDDHGRHDLPWQHPRTPYRVWLSEIMLQQTQVATVIPYFERFLERFPDLESLAAADTDEVLALWSGLGYYARARNLHRAAGQMVEQGVPETVEGWAALPGVGPSTAAAIVAQAFDERAVILDGNVKRVLARHAAVDTPQEAAATQRALWALADEHTPPDRAADYTQAIMDLGATVCRRGKPRCEVCPVTEDCRARIEDRTAELPLRRKRKARPVRERVLLWLEDGEGNLFLEKRPPSGIWGGLASLPVCESGDGVESRLAELGMQRTGDWHSLGRLRHGFSHFELAAEVQGAPVRPAAVTDRAGEWHAIERLVSEPLVGLPAPVQRLIRERGVPAFG
ncbi:MULTISPECIES: A/G-specific adenine glycosylase [unclassified Guyparkeria]|uniref:A/G-specific adenine glycosylase n=1 Tax=unclassified Guyparkeria TaxID=2626246 RepID=UPI00073351E5|nr:MULTISPECIES: A/G-specific adenine glycosylase [unclassified Guyparkeria]KTG16894.1 A/G-specific adenine glycosylase [Guyparkeria sp. XI15]OAE85928.1 A/G-specific adenine glycosylase [Guyparkeria sp. WRN-7]